MADDLVERLLEQGADRVQRVQTGPTRGILQGDPLCAEAAERIAALTAERDALREQVGNRDNYISALERSCDALRAENVVPMERRVEAAAMALCEEIRRVEGSSSMTWEEMTEPDRRDALRLVEVTIRAADAVGAKGE